MTAIEKLNKLKQFADTNSFRIDYFNQPCCVFSGGISIFSGADDGYLHEKFISAPKIQWHGIEVLQKLKVDFNN